MIYVTITYLCDNYMKHYFCTGCAVKTSTVTEEEFIPNNYISNIANHTNQSRKNSPKNRKLLKKLIEKEIKKKLFPNRTHTIQPVCKAINHNNLVKILVLKQNRLKD